VKIHKNIPKEVVMEKTISKDGTPIAYIKQGNGPPLILVHGAGSIANRWFPIIPALAEHFTVYALERRGRGESGDTEPYAIEREFEDITALVNVIEQPVNLLGHSFGALLALEAALLIENLDKLLLYEPPLLLPELKTLLDELMVRYESLLLEGKNEEALIMFYNAVGISPQEIQMMQSTPEWRARVEAAYTILRESRGEEKYTFKPERFGHLQIPTLLMLGEDSPPWAQKATQVVDQALPNSSILVLPGQKHVAMVTAPDLFVQALIEFFLAQADVFQ
jgi:pimeloyl-ACP methyl ester carboxylesterase